jgi:hypothetical protein
LLVALSEIKPSPFNPKKPFTKKRYAALLNCVKKFGFQRSLCVCRDFLSGGGFICLDGNTALSLLADLGYSETECNVVENVTDEKTLRQFMAGYSVSKEPLYNVFADELGKADFEAFTGLSADKYMPDIRIDAGSSEISAENYLAPSQCFLTLPPVCFDKLRSFTKTRAFKCDKTEALINKIDSVPEKVFLEKLMRIIM